MHPDLETQPFAQIRLVTLQAQRDVLMEVFPEAQQLGRAAAFLKDPRVLPLCELILNGVTSYEVNRPDFTGGQNSRRIAFYGT